MATEILPVADTKVNSADITFSSDTAIWVSGSRGLDVEYATDPAAFTLLSFEAIP